MVTSTLDTVVLRDLVVRGRQGEKHAYGDLLRQASLRLERMAHSMLNRFPVVRRQTDTGDVLQGALIRLWRALQVIEPMSTRDFYALAAKQIRRELLDLARRFQHRVQFVEPLSVNDSDGNSCSWDAPDTVSKADLERWADLHEAVDELPVTQREVFNLCFYHGWTQQRIAELLQITDRQVRRHWNAALLNLTEKLGGILPTMGA